MSMEKFIRKSLLKRENCFERDIFCPQWINDDYPQLKSIEFDVNLPNRTVDDRCSSTICLDDEFNEEKSFEENLLDRIDFFDKTKCFQQIEENQCEYPDEQSFYSSLFDHYHQTNVCSSTKQLKDLVDQIDKYFRKHFSSFPTRLDDDDDDDETSLDSARLQCQTTPCLNVRLPLTRFCSKHFLENDQNQILFEKCFLCQQIVVKHDDKHFFHLSCRLNRQ